jgi:hypothetical protein
MRYDFLSCHRRPWDITLDLAHGFGARPNFAYPDVKEGFEKAFQQAVDWFNKTIPDTPQASVRSSFNLGY